MSYKQSSFNEIVSCNKFATVLDHFLKDRVQFKVFNLFSIPHRHFRLVKGVDRDNIIFVLRCISLLDIHLVERQINVLELFLGMISSDSQIVHVDLSRLTQSNGVGYVSDIGESELLDFVPRQLVSDPLPDFLEHVGERTGIGRLDGGVLRAVTVRHMLVLGDLVPWHSLHEQLVDRNLAVGHLDPHVDEVVFQ
jgi:hypothetical protein